MNLSWNTVSDWLQMGSIDSWLTGLLLKSCLLTLSAILIAYLLTLKWLGHKRPSLGHICLTATLIGLAALPIVTSLPPLWQVEVASLPQEPLSVSAPLMIEDEFNPRGQNISQEFPPGLLGDSSENGSFNGYVSSDEMLVIESSSVQTDLQKQESLVIHTEPSEKATALPWPVIGLCVYLAGVIFFAGRLMFGWLWLRKMTREGTELDWNKLEFEFGKINKERDFAERNTTFLIANDQVSVPMVWGLFRSTILVPSQFSTWEEDRQRVVLSHELAHVTRHDAWWDLIAAIVGIMYWFHPLVWWNIACHRRYREQAADALVLDSGVDLFDYSRQLLASVAIGSSSPSLAAPFVRGRSIHGRIRALLSRPKTASNRTRWSLLTISFISVSLLSTVGLVQQIALAQDQAVEENTNSSESSAVAVVQIVDAAFDAAPAPKFQSVPFDLPADALPIGWQIDQVVQPLNPLKTFTGSGIVLSPDGSPSDSTVVALIANQELDWRFVGDPRDDVIAVTTTDSNGAFSFQDIGLPPNSSNRSSLLTYVALKRGYGTGAQSVGVWNSGTGLTTEVRLSEEIIFTTQVVDRQDQSIANAIVELTSIKGHEYFSMKDLGSAFNVAGRTDLEGNVTLHGIPHSSIIPVPQFKSAKLDVLRIGLYVHAEGKSDRILPMVISEPKPITMDAGSLVTGVIKYNDGTPASGKVVIDHRVASDYWGVRMSPYSVTLLDENGAFEIRSTRIGPLTQEEDGLATIPHNNFFEFPVRNIVVIESDETKSPKLRYIINAVNIKEPTSDLTIALEKQRMIRGRVIDLDGLPLGGVDVRWNDSDTPESSVSSNSKRSITVGTPWVNTVTDTGGYFQLAVSPSAGMLSLVDTTFKSNADLTEESSIEISAGEVDLGLVEFQVKRKSTFQVQVLNPDGLPASNLIVSVQQVRFDKQLIGYRANREGLVSIPITRPGQIIRMETNDDRGQHGSMFLTPEPDQTVDFQLQPKLTLDQLSKNRDLTFQEITKTLQESRSDGLLLARTDKGVQAFFVKGQLVLPPDLDPMLAEITLKFIPNGPLYNGDSAERSLVEYVGTVQNDGTFLCKAADGQTLTLVGGPYGEINFASLLVQLPSYPPISFRLGPWIKQPLDLGHFDLTIFTPHRIQLFNAEGTPLTNTSFSTSWERVELPDGNSITNQWSINTTTDNLGFSSVLERKDRFLDMRIRAWGYGSLTRRFEGLTEEIETIQLVRAKPRNPGQVNRPNETKWRTVRLRLVPESDFQIHGDVFVSRDRGLMEKFPWQASSPDLVIEAEIGSTIQVDGIGLIGGFIGNYESPRVQEGEGEWLLEIPVRPAGIIRGKITVADGSSPVPYRIILEPVYFGTPQPNERNHFYASQGFYGDDQDGSFVIGPIPLDERADYIIKVQRGSQVGYSEHVVMTDNNPIADVSIELPVSPLKIE